MLQTDRNKWWLALAALSCIAIFWVALGLYQSHFISALRILGDYSTQSIIGASKEGRGDEWSTYLPILKQAYLEGFPNKSSLVPYYENLEWVISIPKFNASLFFLPNHIAFWVLPGANALALQGAYYNLIFLFSLCWLLKNLGVKPGIAISVSLMILFSQMYQVWWTSNFPALGAGILPFAIFASRLRPLIKFPLFFWAVGHVIFGQIYPPFYVSLAAALLPILLAVRPDLIDKKHIFWGLISAAAAIGCFLLMRWDYVNAVSTTSYPGVSVSTGGGVQPALLLSAILPSIPVGPGGPGVDPVHEFSLIGTILPVIFLSLLPFIKWDKFTRILTIATAVMLIFMSVFMLIGFPRFVSKISLFYLVPGRRMLLGFSLLIVLYCTVMISHQWQQIRISAIVLACFIFSAISYAFGVRHDIETEFYLINWLWITPTLLALLAIPVWLILKDEKSARNVFISLFFAGIVCFQFLTYGSFNPIMNAADILRPVDNQLTRDVRKLVQLSDGKGASVIGNYGHLLRGEGLAVYNAIHLVNVNREIYAELFDITQDESNTLFNQFRGISFDNIGNANTTGATVIFPGSVGAVAFDHNIINSSNTVDSLITNIQTGVIGKSEKGFNLFWNSRLSQPVPVDANLTITLPCATGNSWMTRYPLIAGGEELVDVALRGVSGRIEVETQNLDQAQACLKQLAISLPKN
ncbi:hypothetical protein M5G27_20825 [Pseudomonas shahriarae]|uniref:DUF7657 domain-containing protein n=1 Tax=Pseudomonas shahriarae TaxID=2745512 RepID=A0A9X4C471_9PSED|nr:hypothetical protein [Pseudomonas shahriarae]MDD1009925.1 hypothetical protein [Pseudomonas shahriarae]